MEAIELSVLTLAAYLTGTLSAVIGMGGGITLMACMTLLMPAADVVPVHGAIQLVSNSSRTLLFIRHAAWRLVLRFLPGLAVGVSCGIMLFSGSDLSWFKPLIGGFIFAFLIWRRVAPKLRNPPGWSYTLLGGAAGFAALFIGATGPLLAPFFLRDDLDKAQIVATKAACQTAIHLVKIPAFLSIGYAYESQASTLLVLSVAVVAGTFTGKRLQGRLTQAQFVRLFEGVLAVLGAVLLAQALG